MICGITAANTSKDKKFGFVFIDCIVSADSSVNKLYLGRPWRAYAKTVFIHCALPDCIVPEGWNNWNNTENEKTAYYAEYKNTGAGSKISGRADWSRQLSDKEAKEYSLQSILGEPTGSGQAWYNVSSKAFEWPGNKK